MSDRDSIVTPIPIMAASPSSSGVRRTRAAAFMPLGVLMGLSLAGCVTVPPSQRGELAKPEMDPASIARQKEETFHNHVEAAREGGMGGHGGQGGGCGCG